MAPHHKYRPARLTGIGIATYGKNSGVRFECTPFDFHCLHRVLEHGGVPTLPGTQHDYQRPLVAVDQRMDLDRQPATGAPNRMMGETP